ncbi:MAG TPA: MFS transporter [Candidatus Marinimicrobia bacterium]|nr:MFS transporter [Candidatus Neomarinimicrobiota bacterium]HIB58907.1 MFS transporter [Candidatus Neomarinimicrobiota bacterium]
MINSRKSIWSWSMYDWANSAFATTVMAGFFPLFFKAYWADPGNPEESTFYLGLANSLASIIVAALAPFLGAIADRGSAKKKFLFTFAFFGIIMTSGLWFVAQGYWQMAVIFYVAASVGFSGGNIFYDSLLPSIADESKVNYASSLGYALGYIGGGLLFLLNVLMFKFPETFGLSDSAAAIKLSFVSVAIWWALFSIPVMLFVREPQIYDRVPLSKAVTLGWKQLRDTLRDIRHLKVVGLFLLAYWFYIDGVDTIVKMAVDYGMSLNFEESALITALLIVQFVAFPAALIYNWIASRIGTKRAIEIAIMAYCFITLLGYFMQTEQHFFVLAILVGLFQGGIQALSRSLYTRLIPAEKAAEFFGFFNMLGKFAAVLGPMLMGSVTLLTGNARLGILSILILFAIGWYLLRKVDISEGERMAREFLAK